jgi:hypothetical protein
VQTWCKQSHIDQSHRQVSMAIRYPCTADREIKSKSPFSGSIKEEKLSGWRKDGSVVGETNTQSTFIIIFGQGEAPTWSKMEPRSITQ